MPVKTAPSGTGAVPVRVSGPVTAAYAAPSCSQKTSPSRTPATDVIVVTRPLVHVHTLSTHGESDTRVSNHSPTPEDYAPKGRGGPRDQPRETRTAPAPIVRLLACCGSPAAPTSAPPSEKPSTRDNVSPDT
ncbi:hypothetical protein GCM10010243_17840 [Streptomyces matensis]|nr:hypothetical protein GCM10010243_17840 [Streptomyces matensis]